MNWKNVRRSTKTRKQQVINHANATRHVGVDVEPSCDPVSLGGIRPLHVRLQQLDLKQPPQLPHHAPARRFWLAEEVIQDSKGKPVTEMRQEHHQRLVQRNPWPVFLAPAGLQSCDLVGNVRQDLLKTLRDAVETSPGTTSLPASKAECRMHAWSA